MRKAPKRRAARSTRARPRSSPSKVASPQPRPPKVIPRVDVTFGPTSRRTRARLAAPGTRRRTVWVLRVSLLMTTTRRVPAGSTVAQVFSRPLAGFGPVGRRRAPFGFARENSSIP